MENTTEPNKILIGLVGLLFISSAFGIMIVVPDSLASAETIENQTSDWNNYGVVLDIGGVGQDLHVFRPYVMQNSDGTYSMWYTGDGDDGMTYYHRIFKASSPDGLSWTKEGMVLDYGGTGQEHGVLYPYITIDNTGVYHMWYTGINTGNHASIYRAESYDDGYTWTKCGQELDYGDSFDVSGTSSSAVYYDGSEWHMWYVGVIWGSPNTGRICHAHKTLLSDTWVKDGIVLNNDGPYDYPSASFPWVMPTNDGFEMFYTGYIPYTGPSRLLHATSPDGIVWTKTGIIMEGTGPLENNFIGMASVMLDDNDAKYWYSGYDGVNWRIFYTEQVYSEPPADVDISILNEDITFSDSDPLEGDVTTISATIHGDEGEMIISQETELLFSDGFETGFDNWELTTWNPSGLLEITSQYANSGAYLMHAQSNPGTDTGPYVYKKLDSTYSNIIAETMIYLPVKIQEYNQLVLLRAAAIGSDNVQDYNINLMLDNDNYGLDVLEYNKDSSGTVVRYESGFELFEFSPNQWYSISVQADETTFSVYVDGNMVLEAARHDSDNFDSIFMGDTKGSSGGWGDAYWDDAKIWTMIEDTSTVPGLDAECTVSFYLDTIAEANLIDRQENIFVPAGQNITVEANWTSIVGTHEIIVDVTNVNPTDIDISNNLAYANINVASIPQTEEVDLSVFDQDITFSNSNPIEGDAVTVSALIHGDECELISTENTDLVFSDNFDSGNLNQWFLSNWNPEGVLEVSSAVSDSPPYSLHSQSDPYTNTGPYVVKFFDDSYSHILVETSFYLPVKTQMYEHFDILRLGSSSTASLSTANYDFFVVLGDDDYSIDIYDLVLENGVWSRSYLTTDVLELSPTTWYDISLELTESEYILKVNDLTIITGLRTASNPIHHLLLGDEGGSGGVWGDAYWDDVNVWSLSEGTSPTPGLDAECTVSFYLDTIDDANLIDCQENVYVPAGQDITVSTSWNAIAGNHQIIVDITNVNPLDIDLSNNVAFTSIEVSSANVPPVADAGLDQVVEVNTAITFDGSGSYDPDGTIVSYVWDFGDNITGTGISPVHSYSAPGDYIVGLTVTDDDGATDSDICLISVYVPNVGPVADAGLDQVVEVNTDITFDGSGSYDPDGTIVSYAWDFGDGATGTGETITYTYTAEGIYSVILTVTDDDGATAQDTCQVEITPEVVIPTPANITIIKEKTAGPDIVETHTKYGWELQITVQNNGGSNASEVVVHDVLPAELMLNGHAKSKGEFAYAQNGGGRTGSTRLEWRIGTLVPGEQAELTLWISTRPNPAGQQEFTSPGEYSLNDGAWLVGIDDMTGDPIEAGPTSPIYVTAIEPEEQGDVGNMILPDYGSEIGPVEEEPMFDSILENVRNGLTIAPPARPELIQNAELDNENINSGGSYALISLLPSIVFVILASMVVTVMLVRAHSSRDNSAKRTLDQQLVRGEITEEEYLNKAK